MEQCDWKWNYVHDLYLTPKTKVEWWKKIRIEG